KAMREVVDTLKGSVPAQRAWKRAVSDHLIDRISAVNPGSLSEGSMALDFDRLTRSFKKYEKALAEVYTPVEMAALQRARKLLEPLAKQVGPAAARPNTKDASGELFWRTLRLGLYAHYGSHLKAGGMAARIKDAV